MAADTARPSPWEYKPLNPNAQFRTLDSASGHMGALGLSVEAASALIRRALPRHCLANELQRTTGATTPRGQEA
jgi:hypothetical protein